MKITLITLTMLFSLGGRMPVASGCGLRHSGADTASHNDKDGDRKLYNPGLTSKKEELTDLLFLEHQGSFSEEDLVGALLNGMDETEEIDVDEAYDDEDELLESVAADFHKIHNESLVPAEMEMEFEPDCGANSPTDDERMKMAQVMEDWKDAHHNRDLSDTSYVIDVHFHVLQPNRGTGNISLTQVRRMMAVLNAAFAGTPFSFKLVSGRRIFNRIFAKCLLPGLYKRILKRGGDRSLNVYLCDAYSRGFGGYAHFPPVTESSRTRHLDGIVNMNPALPGTTEYAVAYTFVHEVGHYLGLMHTFQDGCNRRTKHQVTYGGKRYYFQNGDGVEDTAAQRLPTSRYKETKYCYMGQGLNTCRDSTPGVDKGLDPVDNYMNYIPGRCRRDFGRFTKGQIERMVAEFEKYRLT